MNHTTESWGQLLAEEAPKMLFKAAVLLLGGLAMYLPATFFGMGYAAITWLLEA